MLGRLLRAGKDGARPKTSLSSIRTEEYNGSRSAGSYKRWKKAVQAMQSLYHLADSDTAMLVYVACKGEVRDTLGLLVLEDMLEQGGLEMIWRLLDDAYGRVKHERFDEAESFQFAGHQLPNHVIRSTGAVCRWQPRTLSRTAGPTLQRMASRRPTLGGSLQVLRSEIV